MADVNPIRTFTDEEALASLREQGRTTMAAAALARQWGWNERKAQRKLDDWETDKLIRRRGRQITALGTALIRKPDMSVLVKSDIESDMSVLAKPDTKPDIVSDTKPDTRNDVSVWAPSPERPPQIAVPRPPIAPDRHLGQRWHAAGRGAVGLAIISTGAFIAYTPMRANAWFGHSLTPDPVAGEVYSQLSVAAEVLACLIPTGVRFYFQSSEPWSAVRGWGLMAISLVVVFFAAGGFAVSNLNAGIEARAERETPAIRDLRTLVTGLDRSIASECTKRGDRCRDLERQRAEANAKLAIERSSLKADADPQAAALGVTSATLHLVQAGAMVALCLFSGLFISFGAGLIWPRGRAA
jgi:hypothetical protein